MLADFSCLVGNDFFSCLSIHDHFKHEIAMEKQLQQPILGKFILVIWAMLANLKMPITFNVMKQPIIDCKHESFRLALFPQRMIKSGRIHDFVLSYSTARSYYQLLTNPPSPLIWNNQLNKLFHSSPFPTALTSVLLRRFLTFETVSRL